MTRSAEWRTWLAVLVGAVLFVWLFQAILLPFVLGFAVAYLLDPVVCWLEQRGIRRWAAALLVLVAFALVVAVALLLLLPVLENQIGALIKDIPSWLDYLDGKMQDLLALVEHNVSQQDMEQLRQQISGRVGEALGVVGKIVGRVVAGGFALVNTLGVLIVTPLVAYYLLRDWRRLVALVDGWLPRAHADTVRHQARLIDEALAGFVRGQGLVCLMLGTYYAIGLSAAGLRYGFTIGLMVGLLSFMPYVGSMVGFVASVGVAVAQFDSFLRIGIVAGVFFFGQFVEGHFLTPRLVGDRVGLHPLWVIFALFAGGTLMGFVGMLVAIPVAAVIGVLSRFVLSRYLESPLYRGGER